MRGSIRERVEHRTRTARFPGVPSDSSRKLWCAPGLSRSSTRSELPFYLRLFRVCVFLPLIFYIYIYVSTSFASAFFRLSKSDTISASMTRNRKYRSNDIIHRRLAFGDHIIPALNKRCYTLCLLARLSNYVAWFLQRSRFQLAPSRRSFLLSCLKVFFHDFSFSFSSARDVSCIVESINADYSMTIYCSPFLLLLRNVLLRLMAPWKFVKRSHRRFMNSAVKAPLSKLDGTVARFAGYLSRLANSQARSARLFCSYPAGHAVARPSKKG